MSGCVHLVKLWLKCEQLVWQLVKELALYEWRADVVLSELCQVEIVNILCEAEVIIWELYAAGFFLTQQYRLFSNYSASLQ
jgi:hypothetical protein